MHQPFVTAAPHLRRRAGDSGSKVRCSDLLSSSAVRGNCRASDIMQIYPRRIYYYKEQGYDSQYVPAMQGFDRAVVYEKSLSPLITVAEGNWLHVQMTDAY